MPILVPVTPVVGLIGLPTTDERASKRLLTLVAGARIGRVEPATLDTGVRNAAALRVEVAKRAGPGRVVV